MGPRRADGNGATVTAPALLTGWRDDRTLPGSVALTVLTVSVALGLSRLFAGAAFLGPVVLSAIVGHAVAWWCRRNVLPTAVAFVATMGAVGLVTAWTVLGQTTAYGIPLPLTVRTAAEALGNARALFSTVKAPAAPLAGFVLASSLAMGSAAFMADWAAFRLSAAFEALIPGFTVFLFTAALGTPRHRTWTLVLFVGSVLAFLFVNGLARTNRTTAWFGGRPAGGPGALIQRAATLSVAALVIGLLIGPLLPGPSSPLVKYKNRVEPGPSSRATISPLVDIRGRIVDQRETEVFTVKSDRPAYWRLTSLDTFDGNIWSSNSTYHDVRGAIRSDEVLQAGLPVASTDQRFSISDLASIWLPAAFRPVRASGVDVSFAPDTSSLITAEDTTDGTVYNVLSAIPQMTPQMLDQAPPQAPQAIIDTYLALPPIPDRVRTEALRIVAGATTPYQRAMALQNHFKTTYRYDINAGAGHDERTLETFLFKSKAGYCEQFAGVYAVLARSIGLPARVAVGFTPGVLDPDDGLYHVKGGHGHAWAEVYLQGFGWVEFDPTPGRGDPQAASYTGQPAAQDDSLAQDGAGAGLETPSTVAPPSETPTTDPIFGSDDTPAPETATPDRGPSGIVRLLLVLLALAGVWAVVVPALHVRRRRQRRARPGFAGQVLADWDDTVEVLTGAGIGRRPSETMDEYAERAVASAGLQPDPAISLRRLAGDAAIAAYTDGDVPEPLAVRAAHDAHVVRVAVHDQESLPERFATWLDPRPLLTSGRRE